MSLGCHKLLKSTGDENSRISALITYGLPRKAWIQAFTDISDVCTRSLFSGVIGLYKTFSRFDLSCIDLVISEMYNKWQPL